MEGQIRISPEQMRSRAGEYRTQAETVGGVISSMDTLLSALQGEWEGESSKAFQIRFEELRPTFFSAQELINEIAATLDANANEMEAVDYQMAANTQGS